MQEAHLSHKHSHTLQQIFQHPASHNLEWHAVVALVKDSGVVHEEGNGRLTFTLNGITEVFHPSHGKKEVSDAQQVWAIRSFLERAGFHKDGTIAVQESDEVHAANSETEQHSHDHGRVNAEQNQRAEQQLKTQQHEQNDRSAFLAGDAQAHQQGNRQK